jgi:hypothetical protein
MTETSQKNVVRKDQQQTTKILMTDQLIPPIVPHVVQTRVDDSSV